MCNIILVCTCNFIDNDHVNNVFSFSHFEDDKIPF